jgi:hypothetical protein
LFINYEGIDIVDILLHYTSRRLSGMKRCGCDNGAAQARRAVLSVLLRVASVGIIHVSSVK